MKPVKSIQHRPCAETLNPEIYLNILTEARPFLKFKLKKMKCFLFNDAKQLDCSPHQKQNSNQGHHSIFLSDMINIDSAQDIGNCSPVTLGRKPNSKNFLSQTSVIHH